jgi:hypothetical protein
MTWIDLTSHTVPIPIVAEVIPRLSTMGRGKIHGSGSGAVGSRKHMAEGDPRWPGACRKTETNPDAKHDNDKEKRSGVPEFVRNQLEEPADASTTTVVA